MIAFLVRHLRGTIPYRILRAAFWRLQASRLNVPVMLRRERRVVASWERAGRPVKPPPQVKRAVIASYADRYGLRTLVETGTYTGGTIARMLRRFDRIVSIELDEEFAERARRKFVRHGHVTILQGNSSELLPEVVAGLERPALFWLDAHYSGGATARGPKETPIVEELECILASTEDHVVLIDDASDFTGGQDYPSVGELETLVARRPGLRFEVADDVIRITPAQADEAEAPSADP